MAIPGIVQAHRSNCHRSGINWTAIYELADNELDRLSAVDSSHSCDRVRQLLTSFGEL